jgi:hypothetical protein
MLITNQTLSNATEQNNRRLIDIIQDISFVYVITTVCVVGFFLNIINILVLSRCDMKSKLYKYLLLNSFINLILLVFSGLLPIAKCGNLCAIARKYEAKLFIIVFVPCVNFLTTMSSLLNIQIAADRYMLISQRFSFARNISYKLLLTVYFVISLVMAVPYGFRFYIIRQNNANDSFALLPTGFVQSSLGGTLIVVISLIQNFLFLLILAIFGTLSAIELKKFVNKKKKLTRRSSLSRISTTFKKSSMSEKNFSEQESADNRLTLMVIWMCGVYTFGHIPMSISYVLWTYVNNCDFCDFFTMIADLTEFIAFGFDFFLYFHFNKNFKAEFKCLFRKLYN